MEIRMNDTINAPAKVQQRSAAEGRQTHQNAATENAAPKVQETKNVTEDVKKGVDQINNALEAMNHSLRFQVYEETDDVQVQVVDTNSNKVIKEIPADSALELSSKIQEMAHMFQKMVGVLVDEYV